MSRQIFNIVWGELGDIVDPGSVKLQNGWAVEAPPREYFNWWQNKIGQQLQYIERNGIAEWDATIPYVIGGFVRVGSVIYRSLTAANTGNDPTTTLGVNWEVPFMKASNNLSDVSNTTTARTNLSVYSIAEIDGAFLRIDQNLADVANVVTARANLGVYSTTESNNNYLLKASNLADLPNKTTARTNLQVYSTAESDTNFLNSASNLSDLGSTATARTNLDVYSKLESDTNFLNSTSNLSDLANVITARANLSVYSIASADSTFVALNQNLFDLPNKATARTNLSVYSIADADSTFLKTSNNLSELVATAVTARTNLSVYSKAEVDGFINTLDTGKLDVAGTAINSSSLGGIAAANYPKLNTANSFTNTNTFTGACTWGSLGDSVFQDNVELRFGTGLDARLRSDGTGFRLRLLTGNWTVEDNSTTRFTFFRTTGDFTATGNITAFSDERVKTNFKPIKNSLGKTCSLKGWTYDRTDVNGPRQVGLKAQDVQKVLPEAVIVDKDGNLSLAYGNLAALFVENIKDLKKEIDELKRPKESLFTRVFKLIKRLRG